MIKSLHIKALFWIAVATWAFSLWASGVPLTTSLMKPSGLALGVVTAVIALFEKYVWRWRIFRPWFVATPDLIGTYKGEIKSFWKNPDTGKCPDPIPAFVSIHQTLSGLTVRLFTKESTSVSLATSLSDSPDGHWDLVFTYRNEPELSLQHRSRIHHGGARVSLDGTAFFRLKGNYWTDRETFGEMIFERVSRKRSCSFMEAIELVSDEKIRSPQSTR